MTALPAHAHVDGRWQLGGGYAAIVFRQGDNLRTFEIRRNGTVVAHIRRIDDAMRVVTRDVTGDGIRDVLVENYVGGSGGCGTWRLYGGPALRELWVQSGCADFKRVLLARDGLHAWRGVDSAKTGTSPHCCWHLWRETTWRWSGGRLERAGVRVERRLPAEVRVEHP